MAVVTAEHPGLTATEAAAPAAALGERAPERSSRTLTSIVRSNVFTLVNAIALGFLILIVVAGAWADAIFAVIIVINTAIGITQEVLAKRKLDKLALLVAPRARVRRDGRSTEVTPEELVPGDVVEVGAGDQVLADGVVLEATRARARRVDPHRRVRPHRQGAGRRGAVGRVRRGGQRPVRGPGRRRRRLRGQAHQPGAVRPSACSRRCSCRSTPCCGGCWWPWCPSPQRSLAALWLHDVEFQEGAQTATAGLISIVPEGLVLLASVTLAVAAVRISKTGAIVQQLNAVESLAGVDTVCLDKTGTLTDGSLELIEVLPMPGGSPAEARSALTRLVGASQTRSTTSEAIAEALDTADVPAARRELPFSSRWKWSGVEGLDDVLVLGAPEVLGAGELGRRGAPAPVRP